TLVFEHGDVGRDYRRELDLATAITTVRYTVGDAKFTREVFASHPAQIIAIRLALVNGNRGSGPATAWPCAGPRRPELSRPSGAGRLQRRWRDALRGSAPRD